MVVLVIYHITIDSPGCVYVVWNYSYSIPYLDSTQRLLINLRLGNRSTELDGAQ